MIKVNYLNSVHLNIKTFEFYGVRNQDNTINYTEMATRSKSLVWNHFGEWAKGSNVLSECNNPCLLWPQHECSQKTFDFCT